MAPSCKIGKTEIKIVKYIQYFVHLDIVWKFQNIWYFIYNLESFFSFFIQKVKGHNSATAKNQIMNFREFSAEVVHLKSRQKNVTVTENTMHVYIVSNLEILIDILV